MPAINGLYACLFYAALNLIFVLYWSAEKGKGQVTWPVTVMATVTLAAVGFTLYRATGG